MDPVTVTAVASTLVSTASSVYGLMYQSAVADANAEIAKNNAENVISVGVSETQDIGEENAGRRGLAAARMGASGLGISSPSFAQGEARAQQLNIIEQRRTMEEAYRQAANFRNQQAQFKAESKASKFSIFPTVIGGFLSATGAAQRARAVNIAAGGESTAGQPFDLLQRKKRGTSWFNYGYGFNTGFS